ncbi:hypothetical protein B0H13DRAFT_1862338 [Mycena leptocephala]|nr:hypothetical protein B0H13DRAFT_1862338 [Mycena leptocephala]
MHQYFTRDLGKQHVYLLHGLGGAGKTQIALTFIQESSHYTDISFLDASTSETIEIGLMNLAASKNSLQDALKWLMFPKSCKQISAPISPELRVYAGAHFPVCYMEQKDAVCLLLRSPGEERSPANELIAAEIVKVCYHTFPLAIVQAGSFISTSGDLDNYLDLYMNNQAQLLREKPVQNHDSYVWTVYTTWQISFDHLSKSAAMFLQLCSFLYRDGISEDIFSRAEGYNFPSWGPTKDELQMPLKFLSHFKGPTDEWDTLKFVKITNEIKAYSLIIFDPKRKLFSIHPLVYSWSRTILSNEESYYSCYGMVYYYGGQYQEARKLEESAVENRRKLLGGEHPDTISAMHHLAGTYRILGEFQKAEELGILVVEKRKLDLGDEHPDTISAMHNLALTYGHNQCQKAEELQVIVLEKQKKAFGE